MSRAPARNNSLRNSETSQSPRKSLCFLLALAATVTWYHSRERSTPHREPDTIYLHFEFWIAPGTEPPASLG